jgi:hypothetical protein
MEAMTHQAHTTQNSNDCLLAWELLAVSFILEVDHPTGQPNDAFVIIIASVDNISVLF